MVGKRRCDSAADAQGPEYAAECTEAEVYSWVHKSRTICCTRIIIIRNSSYGHSLTFGFIAVKLVSSCVCLLIIYCSIALYYSSTLFQHSDDLWLYMIYLSS